MNFKDIQIQTNAINNLWFNRIILLFENENYPEYQIIELLKNWLNNIYISGDLQHNKNVEIIKNKDDFSIILKRSDNYYIKFKFFPDKTYIDLSIIYTSHDLLKNIYNIYKIISNIFNIRSLYINSNCIEISHNDIIDNLVIEILNKIKTTDKLTIFCKYAITVKSIKTLYTILKNPNIKFIIQKEFNEPVIRIFDIHARKNIKKYTHIKETQISHSTFELEYKK